MKKQLKKAIATVLTATMMMLVALPAMANTEVENLYENTVNYRTEEAIKQLRSENEYVDNLLMSVEANEPELELIGVQVKEIYVIETYNENGVVTESRVLTDNEVEALENTPDVVMSWIDGAGKDLEKLSFTLAAYDDDEYYRLYGGASWSGYSSLGDKEENPAVNNDFMAISWGGDDTLRCLSNGKVVYGVYSDNTAINFTKSADSSYRGVCWEFAELEDGEYAEDIQINLTLEKNPEQQNMLTEATLTYVHTFTNTAVSVNGFVVVSGIPIPTISCNVSDAYWKDSVSVAGLIY